MQGLATSNNLESIPNILSFYNSWWPANNLAEKGSAFQIVPSFCSTPLKTGFHERHYAKRKSLYFALKWSWRKFNQRINESKIGHAHSEKFELAFPRELILLLASLMKAKSVQF